MRCGEGLAHPLKSDEEGEEDLVRVRARVRVRVRVGVGVKG